MDWLAAHARPVIDSVLYSALGTVVLMAAFAVIEKALPFSLRKEVAEDQNVALAIVVAASILGVAWIVAAAIRG